MRGLDGGRGSLLASCPLPVSGYLFAAASGRLDTVQDHEHDTQTEREEQTAPEDTQALRLILLLEVFVYRVEPLSG